MTEIVERTRPPSAVHFRAVLSRYRRGMSAVWNRPLYGWRWTCNCAATQRVNGTKREAIRSWVAHRETEADR